VTTESIKRTVDAQNQPLEIAQILKFQEDQQFDRYARNHKQDAGSHKKKIMDVVFCEELGNGASKLHMQRVIHSEHGSNIMGIYSTDMKPINKITVPVKVEKTNIMSLCFRDMSTESSNFGPVGTSSLIAIATADSYIHVYAQIKERLEYWKAIPTDGIQDKIWCLKHSKNFLSAGMKDFQIRQWNFSPFVKNPIVGESICIHEKSVTDIVEIRNPPCIITCSLDKTIKMYNLEKRALIRSFTAHHTNGIKQLIYIPGYNRLISRGYEVYVNVWNPENIYGEPFIASLRGHNKPVVSMDDIKGQPYVVTMDLDGEIIIWDVRTMFQLQTVPARSTLSMGEMRSNC
jgi:WD40 repeat protein